MAVIEGCLRRREDDRLWLGGRAGRSARQPPTRSLEDVLCRSGSLALISSFTRSVGLNTVFVSLEMSPPTSLRFRFGHLLRGYIFGFCWESVVSGSVLLFTDVKMSAKISSLSSRSSSDGGSVDESEGSVMQKIGKEELEEKAEEGADDDEEEEEACRSNSRF